MTAFALYTKDWEEQTDLPRFFFFLSPHSFKKRLPDWIHCFVGEAVSLYVLCAVCCGIRFEDSPSVCLMRSMSSVKLNSATFVLLKMPPTPQRIIVKETLISSWPLYFWSFQSTKNQTTNAYEIVEISVCDTHVLKNAIETAN